MACSVGLSSRWGSEGEPVSHSLLETITWESLLVTVITQQNIEGTPPTAQPFTSLAHCVHQCRLGPVYGSAAWDRVTGVHLHLSLQCN